MAFYIYAYYFLAKKDFDLIYFSNERAGRTLSLKKKDEIKIYFRYEVISINIKIHAKYGNPA